MLDLVTPLDEVLAFGDEQPAGFLVRQDLAREFERRRSELVALEAQFERRAIERAVRRVIADQLGDRRVEIFAMPFTGKSADDLAFWIDDDKRRPRIHADLAPDGHLRVVEDGMLDVVAHHRAANVL